eukprot:CAMPEP_0171325500 /NCGR_PEP_ID=MMETSP0816-20121228/116848_1 /TAXON_ID=420281 /ORGANISM="Proboscia inermis, Strain CCAP1064/1" /LENGTH=61 /DNA_ID=CAMNT_0011824691 /DNA_START=216 /DNA_END=401 /DNA_ORIENTATION=-
MALLEDNEDGDEVTANAAMETCAENTSSKDKVTQAVDEGCKSDLDILLKEYSNKIPAPKIR